MPQFVVCQPLADAAQSVAPCADVGGRAYAPVVMELAAPGSITFANSNQLFAYGFTGVIMFWLVGLAVGAILKQIRDA